MANLQDVTDYWFDKPNDIKKWFMSGTSLDDYISQRFKVLLDYYRKTDKLPRLLNEKLGLIILLDQFSRHIYRGKPESFQMDHKAKTISLSLLDSGGISLLSPEEQMFALMPLQHSENIEDLNTLINYLEKQPLDKFKLFLEHSRNHRKVLARFSRYPKRNKVLGRNSTLEEEKYIKENPHSHY